MTNEQLLQKLKLELPCLLDRCNFNITILNGEFCASESYLPKNVTITPLCDLTDEVLFAFLNKQAPEENKMALINTALVKAGFLLEVDVSQNQETIYINHISYGVDLNFNQGRNIYSFKKNSRLSIIERFFSLDTTTPAQINNTVSQWLLEDGAQADICSLDSSSNVLGSKNINNIFVNQKNNSHFSYFSCFINVHSVKNNMRIILEESGAKCNLYSISLLNQSSCVENDIYVEHKKAGCKSNQIYKGVFNDSSRGRFDSLVLVNQDAQQTSAVQKNNNILLSDKAIVQSNPQLEIFADDVECAHGSTTGQIDEAALFYLRSRGINKEAAHSILLKAFLNDVIKEIDDTNVKKLILMALNKKLNTLN